ncbi:MAG TPA: C1 family peptidase, partial [Ignavibacteriaceae bacterium]|nr:C1 family peptidase [Ignavibacteriaceae bacterium]
LVRREEYMNTFPADSGQTGREAMKVIKAIGAVPETVYPYQPVYFNDGPSMPLFAKSVAKYWKISLYERCYSVDSIKKALIKEAVVWLGVPVNKSIFKYKTGILNFNKKDGSAGGHAMLIIGYDDNKKAFKVANSWGLSWGKKGYGWIGYDYFYNCDWFDAWSFDL